MLCLSRQTWEVANEMFLNSKKRKMFLKQYTFLCFLFVGERNGGKEIRSNVEAAVNSLIFCHLHVRLLQAVVHLKHLTHLYTNHSDI